MIISELLCVFDYCYYMYKHHDSTISILSVFIFYGNVIKIKRILEKFYLMNIISQKYIYSNTKYKYLLNILALKGNNKENKLYMLILLSIRNVLALTDKLK